MFVYYGRHPRCHLHYLTPGEVRTLEYIVTHGSTLALEPVPG